MKGRTALILLGSAGVLTGVGLWAKYQAGLSYKLGYDFKNFKLKQFTLNNVALECDLVIDNPTELAVTLRGVDLDVLINGVKVTNVLSTVNTPIEPNSKTNVPLKLSFNPSSLVQNTGILLSTGLNLDNAVMTLRGKIKVRKYGLPLLIPFIYTDTYKNIVG